MVFRLPDMEQEVTVKIDPAASLRRALQVACSSLGKFDIPGLHCIFCDGNAVSAHSTLFVIGNGTDVNLEILPPATSDRAPEPQAAGDSAPEPPADGGVAPESEADGGVAPEPPADDGVAPEPQAAGDSAHPGENDSEPTPLEVQATDLELTLSFVSPIMYQEVVCAVLDGSTLGEQSLVTLFDLYFNPGVKITADLVRKFNRKVKLILHPDKNNIPRSQEAFKLFDSIWQAQLQGPIASTGFSALKPSPSSKMLFEMCKARETLIQYIKLVRSDIKKGQRETSIPASCVVCNRVRITGEMFICRICSDTFNASSQRRASSAPPSNGPSSAQPPPNNGPSSAQPPPNNGPSPAGGGDAGKHELFPGEFKMWMGCGPISRTKVADDVWDLGDAKFEIRAEPFNLDFVVKFFSYCASRLARSSWSGLLAEVMAYTVKRVRNDEIVTVWTDIPDAVLGWHGRRHSGIAQFASIPPLEVRIALEHELKAVSGMRWAGLGHCKKT